MTIHAAGSEDAVGPTIDVFHSSGFVFEVAVFSLNDADRIYPEVSTSQCSCSNNSVSKGGW